MSKSVRLETDAIVKCQKVCDGMLDQLDLALKRAEDLTSISGFGDFPSAVELQAGFQSKGAGGPASVLERLRQYRDAVVRLRGTFSDGGESYATSDGEIRQVLVSLKESGR